MNEALKLMLTGMSTVFFILIMVVVLGNVIIRITNRFEVAPLSAAIQSGSKQSELESSKLAAIVSAVQITTKGKGRVTSVEKMSD
ncbi:OadG family protein [Draconibacterium sp. IB214405]|uniref:OadG family protein n=1 Tax=Draconibacterium sp. IB214405 TaxID=3097352 RepID=UPI002A143761|nr:OadG family protein [Draconibacterium sp. IB214405]MDX8341124.1 OadG family protein [Draconibacterium sp. IB214405]